MTRKIRPVCRGKQNPNSKAQIRRRQRFEVARSILVSMSLNEEGDLEQILEYGVSLIRVYEHDLTSRLTVLERWAQKEEQEIWSEILRRLLPNIKKLTWNASISFRHAALVKKHWRYLHIIEEHPRRLEDGEELRRVMGHIIIEEDKMDMIEFTQEDGFNSVKTDFPEWEAELSELSWYEKLGFLIPVGRYGDEEAGEYYEIRESEDTKKTKGWRYLVALWRHDHGVYILVNGAADLLALELRLVQLFTGRLTEMLLDFEKAFGRFFYASHGHDASDYCDECDPDAMAEKRRLRKECEERKKAAEKK